MVETKIWIKFTDDFKWLFQNGIHQTAHVSVQVCVFVNKALLRHTHRFRCCLWLFPCAKLHCWAEIILLRKIKIWTLRPFRERICWVLLPYVLLMEKNTDIRLGQNRKLVFYNHYAYTLRFMVKLTFYKGAFIFINSFGCWNNTMICDRKYFQVIQLWELKWLPKASMLFW